MAATTWNFGELRKWRYLKLKHAMTRWKKKCINKMKVEWKLYHSVLDRVWCTLNGIFFSFSWCVFHFLLLLLLLLSLLFLFLLLAFTWICFIFVSEFAFSCNSMLDGLMLPQSASNHILANIFSFSFVYFPFMIFFIGNDRWIPGCSFPYLQTFGKSDVEYKCAQKHTHTKRHQHQKHKNPLEC